MSFYGDIREKIIRTGYCTQPEAAAFFQDLYEISIKRSVELCGILYAPFLPTKQYRGPDGHSGSTNGWKNGTPIGVCDHFTANDSARGTIQWFSSKEFDSGGGKLSPSNASSAFVIDVTGEAFCLIDFWKGKSDWHEPSLNGLCVGIEHVNVGEVRLNAAGKWVYWPGNWTQPYRFAATLPPVAVDWRGAKFMQPFTREQITTNLVIKRALMAFYPHALRPELMVDHAMYRTDKLDCGPLWPLEQLRLMTFSQEPFSTYEFFNQYTAVKDAPYDAIDGFDLAVIQNQIVGSQMPAFKAGSVGSKVLWAQTALQSLHYVTNADNKYTDLYVNALRKFQLDNSLDVDGILGPMTEAKLMEKAKPL